MIVVGASSAGAVSHARHGIACWKLAAAFAVAALPGSILGTLANRVVAAETLLVAFAALLLAVAALTWRRGGAQSDASDRVPTSTCAWSSWPGSRSGCSRGLFGVGGGFAVVPALGLGLRVPLRRAIATSLVIVAIVSTIGLGEHLAAGANIAWGVALPFAGAAILTASFGGTIARRLPQHSLARGFALLLAGIAGYLVISVLALGGPPSG